MKSRLITLSIVAVVMASLSMTAQAIPISGAIAFSGGTTLNGSLASATAFTGYSDVQIATATPPTGTYAGLPTGVSSPSPITFADFTFNPVPVSSFVLSLRSPSLRRELCLIPRPSKPRNRPRA